MPPTIMLNLKDALLSILWYTSSIVMIAYHELRIDRQMFTQSALKGRSMLYYYRAQNRKVIEARVRDGAYN